MGITIQKDNKPSAYSLTGVLGLISLQVPASQMDNTIVEGAGCPLRQWQPKYGGYSLADIPDTECSVEILTKKQKVDEGSSEMSRGYRSSRFYTEPNQITVSGDL